MNKTLILSPIIVFQCCFISVNAQIVTYASGVSAGEGPLTQYDPNINIAASSPYLLRNNGAEPIDYPCTEGMSNSGEAFTYLYNSSYNLYTGPYISCTVYPNAGSVAYISGFSMGMRSSYYGAELARWVYSVDGGNTWTDNGSDVEVAYSSSCITEGTLPEFLYVWTLPDTVAANSDNGVQFRVYGYLGLEATGNLQLLSVQINGIVEQVQQCSAISVFPSTDTICSGGSANLSASGAYNYAWTPSSSLSLANSANPTASPPVTTVYTLDNCPNATVTVVVNPQAVGPTLAAQSPATSAVCPGQGVSATFNHGGCNDNFIAIIDNSDTVSYIPGDIVGADAVFSIIIQGQTGGCAWAGCNNTDYTALASWTVDTLPVYNAAGADATCNGGDNGSITITLSSGDSPFSYSIDNGTSFSDTSSVITGLAANTYVVQVMDGNGCISNNSFLIEIGQPEPLTEPFITLANNISCDSLYIGVISVNVTSTGGSSPYQYSLNGGVYQSDTFFSSLSIGVYSVISQDAQNCISPVSDTIIISQPVLGPITATNNSPLCEGDTLKLFASPGLNTVYTWTGPNNFTVQNPVKANSAITDSGTYSVIANDSSCTSLPVTTVVIINPNPAPPQVRANDTLICPNDSAQICVPASFASYYWNTGVTTACFYTAVPGNYYATVTNAQGCSSASANRTNISVYSPPSVSISASGDTLSAYGANAYQWYLNDHAITGATSSIYIARQSGSYYVIITDEHGCTGISNSVSVTVSGIIGEGENIIFEIYPSPTTDKLNIVTNSPALQGLPLEIFDISGRKCVQSNIVNNLPLSKTELDVSELAGGVYILKVGDMVRKFIKQ